MHFISTITLLSAAVAIASATKLQNAMTGLCLDAFYGLKSSAGIYTGPCDQLKHGDWQIVQSGNQVWIHLNEDTGANSGQGWCVDMNPSRSQMPTVEPCNGGANQRFIRGSASQGKWAFKTTFAHPNFGAYVLSSTDTKWGSPAEVGSDTATSCEQSGCNYEWNYIN
ncbi:hypothetical protein FBU30_009655 [Linnemannia zychae]|nr:hypothetical protein FBU30_009655 [Linnemannia zychae]